MTKEDAVRIVLKKHPDKSVEWAEAGIDRAFDNTDWDELDAEALARIVTSDFEAGFPILRAVYGAKGAVYRVIINGDEPVSQWLTCFEGTREEATQVFESLMINLGEDL